MEPVITFSASAGVIDAQTGIIRGVSLITKGPALGHGVMIDDKTLEQVKKAAEQYSGGLKVKLDHSGGAGDIVGYIDTLRIEGEKLLGDLHLLESSVHRAYILEIAERIPDTFGLSIAFSGPSEKSADKLTTLQRCSEIYSVDLVSEPAANPAGFFSRKLKQLQNGEVEQPEAKIKIEIPMNDEMKKAIEGMIQSAMMSMNDKLAKLEAALPPVEEKPAAMSAQTEVVQLAANALWSWLFFAWQKGGWAFAEVLVFWVLIALTCAAFWRIRPLAGALLLPYLVWVAFASYLNWVLWQANPAILG